MGVLELLEPPTSNPQTIPKGFNPWKGFGGFGTVAYDSVARRLKPMERFNPWKGFGGFGTTKAILSLEQNLMFQSLEGIWGFWNLHLPVQVSAVARHCVSIPGRDLGVLEQRVHLRSIAFSAKFQSLEGIWGFWN